MQIQRDKMVELYILASTASINRIKSLNLRERDVLMSIIDGLYSSTMHKEVNDTYAYEFMVRKLSLVGGTSKEESSILEKIIKGLKNLFFSRISSKKLFDKIHSQDLFERFAKHGLMREGAAKARIRPIKNYYEPQLYGMQKIEKSQQNIKTLVGEVHFKNKIPTTFAIYMGDMFVKEKSLPAIFLNPINRDNRGATLINKEKPGGTALKCLHHMGDVGRKSYRDSVKKFYKAHRNGSREMAGPARKTPIIGQIQRIIDAWKGVKIPLLNVNETLFCHGEVDYYCCISGPRGNDKDRERLIRETVKNYVLDSAKKAEEEGLKELILHAPIPSSGIFGYDPRDSLPHIFEGFKEAIAELDKKEYFFRNIKISLFAWNTQKNSTLAKTLRDHFVMAFQ